MICPECRAAGLASVVTEGFSTSTAVHCAPFHDVRGRRHHHDVNTVTHRYSCDRGHRFQRESSPHPCWCGWPGPPIEAPDPAETHRTFVVLA
jgi:hypothetical protein